MTISADSDFKKVKEIFTPVSTIVAAFNNKKLSAAWGTVDVFVDSLSNLDASMKYDATEFCRGAVFGMHGTRLLITTGRKLLAII